MRFVTRLLPNLEPLRTESAGRVTLTFEAGPFDTPDAPEPFMPSDVPTWPYVAFTTGRTWRDVASGYHEIVEKQIAGADLGKLLEGGQAKSRADVIERLLTRLHKEVRYTSVARSNLPSYITDDEPELQGKSGGKGKPWRTKDLVLPVPFLAEWQYRIVPPSGFSARPLPENETLQLGPAVLSKQFQLTADGKVNATFRFDTVQRRFTPEQATALREGLRKLQEEPTIMLGFEQVGEAHLEAGRILEALGEFRRLTEKHPREALHRIQVARALLVAGLRDAAQQEAQAAVALEPSSALAQQTLGWVLQHDWIGRRFGRGWDPKGAEDGYRQALQLEPENLEVKADLAILLEHDAGGRRYGARARIGESIELYRSMIEQSKGTALENNLQFALMWASRFQEILKQARESKTPAGGLAGIVALAATEGSGAAIREASKSIAGEEQRRESLQGAGNLLVGLRLYPQAADLLAASARGSAQAAAVLGRAELIRRIKRHDTLPLVPDDPASLVKQLLSIMVAPEFQLDELKKIFSRYSLQELEGKEEIDRIRTLRAGLSRAAVSAGLTFEVMRDVVLSTIEFSVNGEPDFGYRVRLPAEFGIAGQKVFFCVVEEGKLRVLGDAQGGLGLTVLDLISRGELTKARRWLDWAREELPLAGGDDPLAGPVLARLWTKGGNGDDEALQLAQRAVMLSNSGSYALHTLAALYAESGKASEARDVLLQVLKLWGDDEPTPDDFYVLGRIAEHYGAREAAPASYSKCEKGEDADLPDQSYQLAQRRVRSLKK